MSMNINEMSLEKLKSMVYDEMMKSEVANANIKKLNQVISEKSREPKKDAEPKEPIN